MRPSRMSFAWGFHSVVVDLFDDPPLREELWSARVPSLTGVAGGLSYWTVRRRRGGGQHVERAEHQTEGLRKDTQSPCSHAVRNLREPHSGEPSCGPCLTGAFSLSSFLYVTIWVTFLGSVCGAVNFVRPSVLPRVLGVPKWSVVPPPSRAEPWRRIDQVEWRLDMGLPGFGPCGASVEQRRRRRS